MICSNKFQQVAIRVGSGYDLYMEADMELSKKTTILFSREQHRRLTRLARKQRTSLGDLVRSACEAQYGASSVLERIRAAEALGRFSLPLDDVETMKRQSVPDPEELLP